VAAFEGQSYRVTDEIYQLRTPYSRENLRVLMSLDVATTNMNKKDAIKRKDGDFAVSWVRDYGEGRVFYFSLGHREEIFWNPKLLEAYLAGIQFALGDLPGDATPSAELPAAYVNAGKMQALEQSIAAVASYEGGQEYAALNAIDVAIRESFGDDALRAELAERLGTLLAKDATLTGKDFVCRQLYRLGMEGSVEDVAPLLGDETTVDMARYVLERMDYPAVDDALLAALAKATQSTVQVGIINSLGARGTAMAVESLAELAGDERAGVAEAAVMALGRIGGAKGASTLAKAFEDEETSTALKSMVLDAYLMCADGFAAEGADGFALEIYERVYEAEVSKHVRIAAFKGLVSTRGDEAALQLAEVLMSDDVEMQAIAAGLAKDIPGATATSVLAGKLGDMPVSAQALLIPALAQRGDDAALPVVLDAVASDDESLRVAALKALAKLGDGTTVVLLADTAALAEGTEQAAARSSLDRLRGMEIDAAMLEYLEKAEPKVQAELLRSFAARLAKVAIPALLETAKSEDVGVRIASYDALATLAGEEEFEALVELLVDAEDDTRDAAEAAALSVCLSIEDPSLRAEPLLASLSRTSGKPEPRISLLRLLGQTEDADALDALLGAMKSRQEEIQSVAIRAVAEWPNGTPMDDLFDVAAKSDNPTHRVLALRGYIRMIDMLEEATLPEMLKCYKLAGALAEGADEKRAVLAGLGKVGHPSAVAVIESYLKDEEVKGDAKKALSDAQNARLKATASHGGDKAKNAFDGKADTRWDTGTFQRPGQWFTIDLGWKQLVSKITLDAGTSKNDFPVGYEVFLSNDGKAWGTAVATGKGNGSATAIELKPTSVRYVKIVQTGEKDLYWSIHELSVESK
jgi:HEAT repeat protein